MWNTYLPVFLLNPSGASFRYLPVLGSNAYSRVKRRAARSDGLAGMSYLPLWESKRLAIDRGGACETAAWAVDPTDMTATSGRQSDEMATARTCFKSSSLDVPSLAMAG